MRAAGLIDLVGTVDGKWMGGGAEGTGTDPAAADYCRGAKGIEHSHFFTAAGRFGSYGLNGQQVDDGTYELRGDDAIVFDSITVHYRIDATDHLSFLDVTAPDCAAGTGSSMPLRSGEGVVGDGTCRGNHAWAISAFYPGAYDRVP
jgi:hypothetical protein